MKKIVIREVVGNPCSHKKLLFHRLFGSGEAEISLDNVLIWREHNKRAWRDDLMSILVLKVFFKYYYKERIMDKLALYLRCKVHIDPFNERFYTQHDINRKLDQLPWKRFAKAFVQIMHMCR